MRFFQRNRRSLTWIASLAAAISVASAGATAVLAEGPACTGADGQPVTQEQLAADPTLCPAPAPAPEPAPPAPAPEPAPQPAPEPAPEPAPTADPAPQPDPVVQPDPQPDAVAPTDAAPQPVVEDPAPAQPQPETRTPTTTTPTQATPPTTVAPTPPAPTADPARPTKQPKQERQPVRRPAPARPATPLQERTHGLVRAKQYRAAPFRDARLFREQFTPKGRIPRQPSLPQAELDLLVDAAKGTGTHWSTLTAVAWLESRFNDPVAGGVVGRRLSAEDWAEYGTDGNGDGTVERGNHADQAKTVAVFLAEARATRHEALKAYFTNARRARMATRAALLADYFDALGTRAIVHGLEDPEARTQLQELALDDESLEIYDAGRGDITAGIIDPRVLVAMRFLGNRFDSVSISSLVSGHGVYTASGNVSLHAYGQAFDVAALDGESVLGNQQRGGKTWQAVRELLLLPEAMQSAELISLWEMGGPSFAMADHHDHIHVGFKNEH